MAGAGFGIGDGAGGFVTKLEGDGDAKIGDSAGDVIQITGSLKVAGGTSPIGTTAQYIWTGSKWARLSVNGSAA